MKRLKKLIDWRSICIFLAISCAAGLVAYERLGTSFWLGFGLVAFGMFVNGWIATFEDERPGGFNNPDSKTKGRSPGGQ